MTLWSFGQARAKMLPLGMCTSSISARNMSQHVAACCNRVAKRTQHVALNNVAICCTRLVGACKCWANSVGLCCVDVLLSFDRALS